MPSSFSMPSQESRTTASRDERRNRLIDRGVVQPAMRAAGERLTPVARGTTSSDLDDGGQLLEALLANRRDDR